MVRLGWQTNLNVSICFINLKKFIVGSEMMKSEQDVEIKSDEVEI